MSKKNYLSELFDAFEQLDQDSRVHRSLTLKKQKAMPEDLIDDIQPIPEVTPEPPTPPESDGDERIEDNQAKDYGAFGKTY